MCTRVDYNRGKIYNRRFSFFLYKQKIFLFTFSYKIMLNTSFADKSSEKETAENKGSHAANESLPFVSDNTVNSNKLNRL